MAVRKAFTDLCEEFDCNIHLADLYYCSDNAAMVGRCAVDAYELKKFISALDIEVQPRTEVI